MAMNELLLELTDENQKLKDIILELVFKYAKTGEYSGSRLKAEHQPPEIRAAMETLKDVQL